ncbi:Sau3AI family type II restriction endonuclease [Neobacillus sp. CF12]|uniref:Sau3AI family type II restriction endonuclease n=1 Tax=Neobacillus sp. CF12 TaxID=3055864 RepID=UPI0025A0B469|nr:Sau3AI family type II restriction endonuclease [Neobacillus sp. CF12]MDM5326791.1 Sau3AI family type II restriction endonuclease [Neobacillus sp. CF12]
MTDEQYKTKAEVHNHGLEAIGKTLKEINNNQSLTGAHKSGAGDAWETWFGKVKDSDSEPDMRKAGVELKATPIKENKNGTLSAKERLVLNIIKYMQVVKEPFETSHFLQKNRTIELAFYRWKPETKKDDFVITDVALYEMMKNPVDFAIIKQDWHIINDYIKQGRAHELSERLTTYLSPCTKGKTAAESFREQPFSKIPAKQRAYSLKGGYMTYLYRTYVLGGEPSPAIVTNPLALQNKSLLDIILDKIRPFIGNNRADLARRFNVKDNTKSTNPEIIKHMLGIKGAKEDDFGQEISKANIKPKTVVVNKGKKELKEEFKILEYKFDEVIEETWEESELREFLQDTKFLIVAFENDGDNLRLKGAKFWEMPEEDIETSARIVWENTIHKIKTGVEIKWTPNKRTTNFINSSLRNKLFSKLSASQTAYYEDSPNSDKLPAKINWINRPDDKTDLYSDYYMTKQAWWLNKVYIYNQIADMFDSE